MSVKDSQKKKKRKRVTFWKIDKRLLLLAHQNARLVPKSAYLVPKAPTWCRKAPTWCRKRLLGGQTYSLGGQSSPLGFDCFLDSNNQRSNTKGSNYKTQRKKKKQSNNMRHYKAKDCEQNRNHTPKIRIELIGKIRSRKK